MIYKDAYIRTLFKALYSDWFTMVSSWFTVQYRLVWLYWVCVPHLFSLVCCPIICLYVVSSVLWCPLRFPQNNTKKNNVRFVFTPSCLYEGTCLIDVICVCLRIVVSNTYCVVLHFVHHFDCTFGILKRLFRIVLHINYTYQVR